jgi:hypothetical protein
MSLRQREHVSVFSICHPDRAALVFPKFAAASKGQDR